MIIEQVKDYLNGNGINYIVVEQCGSDIHINLANNTIISGFDIKSLETMFGLRFSILNITTKKLKFEILK